MSFELDTFHPEPGDRASGDRRPVLGRLRPGVSSAMALHMLGGRDRRPEPARHRHRRAARRRGRVQRAGRSGAPRQDPDRPAQRGRHPEEPVMTDTDVAPVPPAVRPRARARADHHVGRGSACHDCRDDPAGPREPLRSS
ncbi:hypothetical protein HBB16_11865 [Pseudonocardia sp. MCCB 268]|nr:hypothetical protein [Pseudonocardia cytotoxica]